MTTNQRRRALLLTVLSGGVPAVAPTITSSAPANPVYGVAYTHNYTATGTEPITWSVSAGSLPPGLSLNADTGALTGTPTAAGSFPFTVQASNAGGTATQNATLIVPLYDLVLATQPTHLIGYWPLNETSGTVADDKSSTGADGTYSGGYTLNQTGIGDGYPSVLFDGSTDRIDLDVVTLDTPFDGAIGTMLVYLKVRASSVWTDGVARIPFELGVNANNRVFISKDGTNNNLLLSYRAGGTIENVLSAFSSTAWFVAVVTWSKAAEEMKAYVNGVQVGSTQTALGTFTGTLADGFTAIGNFTASGGANFWDGYIAHAAVWKTRLSDAEIAALAPASFLV